MVLKAVNDNKARIQTFIGTLYILLLAFISFYQCRNHSFDREEGAKPVTQGCSENFLKTSETVDGVPSQ